ncbi:MAG: sialidase family protein, partial [Acidimicrobiia bacterium]
MLGLRFMFKWFFVGAAGGVLLVGGLTHLRGDDAVGVRTDGPAPAAPPSVSASSAAASWTGRAVQGFPPDMTVQDVAVSEAGVFVAVGAEAGEHWSDGESLVIWRSPDGVSWREVFRRRDHLGDGDGYVGVQTAVVAHPDGFAAVASDCEGRCLPVGVHSRDGETWTEVPIPVGLAGDKATAEGSAGGRTGTPVGPGRVVLGSPEYTLHGAEVLDLVAIGSRLVGVGWSEAAGPAHTVKAVWLSDDGGRRWRQADNGAIPGPVHDRDQLDKVVVAGDRLVAGGGNRCCYGQAVSEVWVSDDAGDRWYPVPFPDGKPISISDLAPAGDGAVHVVGWFDESGAGWGEEAVHWRLSADGRWESLPAPPPGRFLAGPDGLVVVDADPLSDAAPGRLRLFQSTDGRQFRLSRISDRAENL